MRKLLITASVVMFASTAMAQTEEGPEVPYRGEDSLAISVSACGAAGGGAAALAATGIGWVPAIVLIVICGVAVDDIWWHLEGNEHR